MSPPVFLLLAVVAVAAALTVVMNRNPVHSACGLALVMFVLSILFVGLHAELVAVLQLICCLGLRSHAARHS